jgi:hypothetical protein
MRDTRVVVKTDRPQLRFKLDVFSAKTEEKLASYYSMHLISVAFDFAFFFPSSFAHYPTL